MSAEYKGCSPVIMVLFQQGLKWKNCLCAIRKHHIFKHYSMFCLCWLWKRPLKKEQPFHFNLHCLSYQCIFKDTRQQSILATIMRSHILSASLFYKMCTHRCVSGSCPCAIMQSRLALDGIINQAGCVCECRGTINKPAGKHIEQQSLQRKFGISKSLEKLV